MTSVDDHAPETEEARRLRAYQAVGDYLLSVLSEVCQDHSISFMLDAGTLLGAYRTASWIPWDDDVDVLMMSSDYSRLRELESTVWPSDVELIDPQGNGAAGGSFVPRLAYRPSHQVVFESYGIQLPERQWVALDIFVLVHGPRLLWATAPWLGALRVLQVARASRTTNPRRALQSVGSFRTRTAVAVLSLVSRAFPRLQAAAFLRLQSAFAGRGSEVYFCPTHAARQRKRALPSDWFMAGSSLEFADVLYAVPDPAPYLSAHFGPDFMTPKVEWPVGGNHRPVAWEVRINGVDWKSLPRTQAERTGS